MTLREKLKRVEVERIAKLGRIPSGYVKYKPLIEFWESLGFNPVKLYSKTMKQYLTSLKRLKNGTLYEKDELFAKYIGKCFNDDEIMLSMKRFSFSVFDNTYLPENKGSLKKIYLSNFLYFPWGKGKMLRSMFLHYYENPPVKRIVDENPALSQKIADIYRRRILFNADAEIKNIDREYFIKASNKMVSFLDQYAKKFRVYSKITTMTAAEWLFDAVTKNANTELISPSYFCSDKTFLLRLPTHLRKIGILS
jgi:hypothetical protein